MAQRKLAYENRIILFLDFLGFKEIVERTEADRQYLHNLLDAIDLLHQVGRDDAEFVRFASLCDSSPGHLPYVREVPTRDVA